MQMSAGYHCINLGVRYKLCESCFRRATMLLHMVYQLSFKGERRGLSTCIQYLQPVFSLLDDVRFHNRIFNTQKRIINSNQVGLYNLSFIESSYFPASLIPFSQRYVLKYFTCLQQTKALGFSSILVLLVQTTQSQQILEPPSSSTGTDTKI